MTCPCNKSCPCHWVAPCYSQCSCRFPYMSGGCYRCCTFGSQSQRKSMAKIIAAKIQPKI